MLIRFSLSLLHADSSRVSNSLLNNHPILLSSSLLCSVFYSRFGQFNRQGLNFSPIDPNRSSYLANPTLSPSAIQTSPYISQTPKPYMQIQSDPGKPNFTQYD